jgi:hypothetical protein
MLFNILIAVSLLLLLGIGVAALFLAGKSQDTASVDKMDRDKDELSS